jgi:hypothetical protein
MLEKKLSKNSLITITYDRNVLKFITRCFYWYTNISIREQLFFFNLLIIGWVFCLTQSFKFVFPGKKHDKEYFDMNNYFLWQTWQIVCTCISANHFIFVLNQEILKYN